MKKLVLIGAIAALICVPCSLVKADTFPCELLGYKADDMYGCKWIENDAKMRCDAYDMKTAYVSVYNLQNQEIGAYLDQWVSSCGFPGTKVTSSYFSIPAKQTRHFIIITNINMTCRQVFIRDCQVGAHAKPCLGMITAEVLTFKGNLQ